MGTAAARDALHLLLPLQMKGRPFALIYADHVRPGALPWTIKALGLLGATLRKGRDGVPPGG